MRPESYIAIISIGLFFVGVLLNLPILSIEGSYLNAFLQVFQTSTVFASVVLFVLVGTVKFLKNMF